MADTIKTVKSSGGDYSSLSAWEAGQQKTVAGGDREIAECDNFSDTTTVTIDGWTVTGEIVIKAAVGHKHTGTRGTGYRLVTGGAVDSLTVNENNVTLDGLELTYTGTTSLTGGLKTNTLATGLLVKDCIIEGTTSPALAAWFYFAANNTSNYKCVNSRFIGHDYGVAADYGTGVFYNCTIVGKTNNAIYSGDGDCTAKNCYMHSAGTVFNDSGSGGFTFTTCKHSTAQSITGSTGSTAYSTANFVNVTAGSEDLRLVSGSALIDAGADLSGDANYAFSTDFDGTTRSGTWDIGFDEYVAAATTLMGQQWT